MYDIQAHYPKGFHLECVLKFLYNLKSIIYGQGVTSGPLKCIITRSLMRGDYFSSLTTKMEDPKRTKIITRLKLST